MKTRLCLALIANKQKGFALPLAVLIGLILMGTGISMMMRAQGDQSKVVAQQARADGLTSSEAGVTRIQDLLNSARVMATVDSHCESGDCWQTAQVVDNPSTDLQKDLNALDAANRCSNNNNDFANKITAPTEPAEQRRQNPGLRDLTEDEWFDLGSNRYYRLISYDYQDRPTNESIGQGILTLEGLSRKRPITDNNDFNNIDLDRDQDDNAASRNRVVVTIPVNRSLPTAFNRDTAPALWIREGATEDRSQTAGITVSNPEYANGADFQGDVVMSDNTAATGFVESTGTLRPNLECHISENNIQQPTNNPPNLPYKAQFIETNFPDLPTIPSDVPSGQSNLNITGSRTFPRQNASGVITDTASTVRLPNGQDVQAYKYTINNITLNGSSRITITPGTRVIFYVKGNILINGSGGIRHDCGSVNSCQPTNFQIYAYGDRSILGANTTPQICLRGNSNLDAFIFAPDYLVGKTGTGNFTGAVWAKSWGKIQNCGSNNGAVAVTQGARWDGLIANFRPAPLASLPQLGNITSWCEEPVDTTNSKCIAPAAP
jgi:hypothetical protein